MIFLIVLNFEIAAFPFFCAKILTVFHRKLIPLEISLGAFMGYPWVINHLITNIFNLNFKICNIHQYFTKVTKFVISNVLIKF